LRIQRGEEGSAGLLGRGMFERINGIIAMLEMVLFNWDEICYQGNGGMGRVILTTPREGHREKKAVMVMEGCVMWRIPRGYVVKEYFARRDILICSERSLEKVFDG